MTTAPTADAARLAELENERRLTADVICRQTDDFQAAHAALEASKTAFDRLLESERLSARLVRDELDSTRTELNRVLANGRDTEPARGVGANPGMLADPAKILELELQLTATRNRLAQANEEIAARHQQADEAGIQAMHMSCELEAYKTQMKDEVMRRESDRAAVAAVEATKIDIEAKLAETIEDLHKTNQKVLEANKRTNSLREELEKSQRVVATERQVGAQLGASLSDTQRQVAKKTAQVRSMGEFLDHQSNLSRQNHQESANAKMNITILQNANDKLAEEKSSLSTQCQDAVAKAMTAERAVLELQDQVANLSSTESSMRMEIDSLNRKQAVTQDDRKRTIKGAEDNETEKLLLWFANLIRDQSTGAKTAPSGASLMPKLGALYHAYVRQKEANKALTERIVEDTANLEFLAEEYNSLEACNRDRSKVLMQSQIELKSSQETLSLLSKTVAKKEKENLALETSVNMAKSLPRLDQEEATSLRQELKELQTNFVNHDAIVRAKEAEAGALALESARLADELASRSGKLSETQKSLGDALVEIEVQRELSSQARAELDICRRELLNAQRDTALSQKKLSDLEKVLGSATEERSALERQNASANSIAREKDDRILELESLKRQLESKVDHVSDMYQASMESSQSRDGVLEKMKIEKNKLEIDLDSKSADLSSARRTIESTEKVVNQLKGELGDLRSMAEAAEREKKLLRDQISHQVVTLSQLQNRFVLLERQKAVWETSGARSLSNRSESEASLEVELESRLSSAEERCVRTRDDLLVAREQLKEKTRETAALHEANVSLQARVIKVEGDLGCLQDSLQVATRSLDEVAKAGRSETVLLQNSVERLQGSLVDRETALYREKQRGDEAMKTAKQLEADSERLSKINTELQTQCANKELACSKLHELLDGTKERLDQSASSQRKLEEDCKHLVAELQNAQTATSYQISALEQARGQLLRSNEQIRSLEVELTQSKEDTRRTEEILDERSSSLDEMRTKWSMAVEQIKTLEMTISQIENSLKAVQQELTDVTADLDNEKHTSAKLAEGLASSKAEGIKLGDKLKHVEEHNVELSKEVSDRDTLVEAVSRKENHFTSLSEQLKDTQSRLEKRESDLSVSNLALVEKCALVASLQQRLGTVSGSSGLEISMNTRAVVEPEESSECSFETKSIASPDLLEHKHRADILAERLEETEALLQAREVRLAELMAELSSLPGENENQNRGSEEFRGGSRSKNGKFDQAAVAHLQGLGEFLTARLAIVEGLLVEKEKRVGHQSALLEQMQSSVDMLNVVISDKENLLTIENKTRLEERSSLESEIDRLEELLRASAEETEQVRVSNVLETKAASEAYADLEDVQQGLKMDLSQRAEEIAELHSTLQSVRKELSLSCARTVEVGRLLEAEEASSRRARAALASREESCEITERELKSKVDQLERECESFVANVDRLEIQLAESSTSRKSLSQRLAITEPLAEETEHAKSCMEVMENRMYMIESQAARRLGEMEVTVSERTLYATEVKTRSDQVLQDFLKIQKRMHGFVLNDGTLNSDGIAETKGGTTRVTFVVTGSSQPDDGSHVIVTGSDAALGSWDVERGHLLAYDAMHRQWRGDTLIAAGTLVEYKFVWKSEADGAAVWESGENRVLSLSAESPPFLQVHEAWR